MILLGLLFSAIAAFVTYLAIEVPVKNLAQPPVLTGSTTRTYWPIAADALLVVLALGAVVVELVLRRRDVQAGVRSPAETVRSDRDGPGIPRPLRIERTPGWAVAATTLASAGVLAGSIFLHQPLWEKVAWTLTPWLPLFVFEEIWKYKHYGFYAVFLGLAALQVGHLGEHTVQVTQLLLYHGDITRSHGVFGQLDFETVHFVWDSLIWVAGAILVYQFWDNAWLWISWAVASVHQVEHVYLFFIYRFHNEFWARGGIAGVFGKGGLIGSPLSRPYLHFVYNFLVIIPMLVGLWDETKRVLDRFLARALVRRSSPVGWRGSEGELFGDRREAG
jgi:hypothetical protein